MSGESRTPSVGASHSEDRSYASNESTDTVRRSSSSSKPSDSVGSHNSYTPRGRKIISSPQIEGNIPSVRIDEGAEIDPLANEPLPLRRDGSNSAVEPRVEDEVVNESNEMALIRDEAELLQDQLTGAEARLHPVFNPEEIKIEQMLADEGVDNALLRAFRPGSSQPTKRRMLADEEVDGVLLRAFGPSSSKATKRRATKKRAPTKRGRAPGKLVPDPPGSTLCDKDSLSLLRRRFNISEEVEFLLPSKSCRADDPPVGCLTLYESFFYGCFLWFPIPSLILHFLSKYGLTIGQIMPRGLRHLIGLIVRSFETGIPIGVHHLQNLLEIRSGSKQTLRYYLSNKKDRRIIGNFPSKDHGWENYFFFVPITGATVGEIPLKFVKSDWQPIGSRTEAQSMFRFIIVVP